MKLSKKACKLLADAQASLKKRKGWFKGSYGDQAKLDGTHCAIGALRAAALANGTNVCSKEYRDAIKALGALAYESRGIPTPKRFDTANYELSIIDFNDNKKTRKKDVTSLFCQAMTGGQCKEVS